MMYFSILTLISNGGTNNIVLGGYIQVFFRMARIKTLLATPLSRVSLFGVWFRPEKIA